MRDVFRFQSIQALSALPRLQPPSSCSIHPNTPVHSYLARESPHSGIEAIGATSETMDQSVMSQDSVKSSLPVAYVLSLPDSVPGRRSNSRAQFRQHLQTRY